MKIRRKQTTLLLVIVTAVLALSLLFVIGVVAGSNGPIGMANAIDGNIHRANFNQAPPFYGPSQVLSSTFTYQGLLTDGGGPANGSYDLQFELYDDAMSGVQVGITLVNEDVLVTDGLFTLGLDFGTVFDGQPLWLEIGVRPWNDPGPFTILLPRQPVTPTPYAFYAETTPWGGLLNMPAGFLDGIDNDTMYTAGTGLFLNVNDFNLEQSYSLPQGCGSGEVPTWNGSGWDCSPVGGGAAWLLSGNSGTTAGTNFLGTTDNQPLEIHVNGQRVFLFDPQALSPNILGGYSGNYATAVYGATIAGGGQSGAENGILALYGTVSGGADNVVSGDFAVIAGGGANRASEMYASVGGGQANLANGTFSTIGGGLDNSTNNAYATIGGGITNTVLADLGTIGGGEDNEILTGKWGTIGGGIGNALLGEGATIGGGFSNRAISWYPTISGGINNFISGTYTTIGGGFTNSIFGQSATIAGGDNISINGDYSSIGGGFVNSATGDYSTIAGGVQNTIVGNYAAIGGGKLITATGGYSAVGGGLNNTTVTDYSTISGGESNYANGMWAAVGGGYGNSVSGNSAAVVGGWTNVASGDYSFIGGGEANGVGQYDVVSGGYWNNAGSSYSSVGGGLYNSVISTTGTIAGGAYNNINGSTGAIGGGFSNSVSGDYGTIPGGLSNIAAGDFSFAAGCGAQANHNGSFVWADSFNCNPVVSQRNDQFRVQAYGGFYLDDEVGNYIDMLWNQPIDTSTGAYLSWGGVWTNASDVNLKENFETVDGRQILQILANMPIQSWNYIAEEDDIRHLGPTAQDFYAAFALGDTDTAIGTVDADGVALAAIQGLYEINQEQAGQIEQLQAQNDELEARLDALEKAVQSEGGTASGFGWLPLLGFLVVGVVFGRHRFEGGGQ